MYGIEGVNIYNRQNLNLSFNSIFSSLFWSGVAYVCVCRI